MSSFAKQLASADFPTRWGHFRIYGFRLDSAQEGKPEEAVALVMGDVHGDVVGLGFMQTTIMEMVQPPAVRSSCSSMAECRHHVLGKPA